MTTRQQHAARAWAAMRTLVLDQNDRRAEVAEALGMSFIRIKAVRQVAAGPKTMRALAVAIGSDAPYTSVLVQDLAERGLIERTEHPEDRRVKVVSITAAGRELAAQADAILNEPSVLLQSLDAADLAELDRILSVLVAEPAPRAEPAG